LIPVLIAGVAAFAWGGIYWSAIAPALLRPLGASALQGPMPVAGLTID
jgi:hypothetical protein